MLLWLHLWEERWVLQWVMGGDGWVRFSCTATRRGIPKSETFVGLLKALLFLNSFFQKQSFDIQQNKSLTYYLCDLGQVNNCFEPQLQHLESTALHVFARTHWKVIYQVSHLGPGAEWALKFREAIFIILHIYLFPKRLLTSRLPRILTYTWSGRPWGNFSRPNGNYTLTPKLLLTPKNFSRMKGMVQEFKLKKKLYFLKNKTVPSCFSPLFLSHDQLLLIVQNSGQYHLLMETFCPCPVPPCILAKPLTHFSEEHSQFYSVNKQQSIYSIELSRGWPLCL